MVVANSDQIEVDIVISTYRRGTSIDKTIASIRSNTHHRFTLWVLDQSDNDLTELCVRRHAAEDERVQYRRMPLRGLCATRNAGSKLGRAPYILFTNDDIKVVATWIESMLAGLITQQAWCAFGRVLPEAEAKSFPPDTIVLGVKTTTTTEVYEHQRFNLSFGHGHNMAVVRARFEGLGGFDELLGAGAPLGAWDERDFGYRILRQRGRIVYLPDAVAYHCHAQDWNGVQRSYQNYGLGTGASVGKYLRCGQLDAMYILLEWMFSQGFRQIISGVLKWQSAGKVRAGWSQLIYPWIGLFRSLHYPIDREHVKYKPLPF